MQQLEMDLAAGILYRDQALAWYEENAADWLALARAAAYQIWEEHGSVTTDDVQEMIGELAWGYSRNVIGSIFKPSHWQVVGMVPTRKPKGHARRIFVWSLRKTATA